MILGSCFLKDIFKTMSLSLWKSESPVCTVQDDWNLVYIAYKSIFDTRFLLIPVVI